MNHSVRISAIVLGLLLAGALVSCGDAASQSDNTDTVASETEATEETTSGYNDHLPEGLDFGGYEFRVLTYETGNNTNTTGWNCYIDIDELNGDLLNDAAFNRNAEVEERLNVHITCHEDGTWDNTTGVLQKSILAGDDAYDLAVPASLDTFTSLISDHLLYDANDLKYIDLSQSWYNQSSVSVYALDGHHYLWSGAYTYTLFSSVALLYNKTLWESLDYADPYQTIRDGGWTLDYVASLAKGVYNDLDGDGKKSMDDLYGFSTNYTMYQFFYPSSGQQGAYLTDDGFAFDYADERSVKLFEKVQTLMTGDSTYNNDSDPWANFFNGNSLMMLYGSSMPRLRELDFDFGFLLTPKLDEEQENYYSYMCGGVVCVPVTITDPDCTGAVIEALFSSSERYIRPAYLDSYVQNKVLRDEGSVEMYNRMLDTATYDFTRYISPSSTVTNYALVCSVMKKKSTDISSAWEKVRPKVEAAFEEFYEEFLSGGSN